MSTVIPNSKTIAETADRIIELWHERESEISSPEEALALFHENRSGGMDDLIEKISIINTCLWHVEDRARDRDAPDSAIAGIKRAIDRLNAARADTVEEIDGFLKKQLRMNGDAPLNTETPGSVIDRLTILLLKQYHMAIESNRSDAAPEHRNRCGERLAQIQSQLRDLTGAFDQLISDIQGGARRFAIYKQFKMYNDPDLNPVLYKKNTGNNFSGT